MDPVGKTDDLAVTVYELNIVTSSVCIISFYRQTQTNIQSSYNSVVFSTLSANDYRAMIVSQSFLEGAAFDRKDPQNLGEDTIEIIDIASMQDNLGSLTKLNNSDCLRLYGSSNLVTDWKNVLLVSSYKNDSTSVLSSFYHETAKSIDQEWFCSGYHEWNIPCVDMDAILIHPEQWTIPTMVQCSPTEVNSTIAGSSSRTQKECTSNLPIEYCLAEPFDQHCAVMASSSLLTIVVICNLIKMLCLLYTAFGLDFTPIATIGDAISSFSDGMDRTTAGTGPVSMYGVKANPRATRRRPGSNQSKPELERRQKTHRSERLSSQSHVFRRRSSWWARSVGLTRWMIGLLL